MRAFVPLRIPFALALALASAAADSRAEGWNFVGFPLPWYSPETQLGIGGTALFSRPVQSVDGSDRSDSVPISVFATTRGQYGFLVSPNLFFSQGLWELRSAAGYSFYPNFFYGLGMGSAAQDQQLVSARSLTLQFSWHRRFTNGLVLGLALQGKRDLLDFERPALVQAVPGHQGGNLLGVGPVFEWDTRDHGFIPSRGVLLKYQPTYFTSAVLGDYEGWQHLLDLRAFKSVAKGHVIGIQGVYSTASQSLPYTVYTPLGMRGISDERFRDRSLLFTQGEYRFPIRGAFGGVVFATAGHVFAQPGDLWSAPWVASGGAGFRYLMDEKAGVNLRVDVGYSSEGFQPYLQLMESF